MSISREGTYLSIYRIVSLDIDNELYGLRPSHRHYESAGLVTDSSWALFCSDLDLEHMATS
jgi:hypothetical protein